MPTYEHSTTTDHTNESRRIYIQRKNNEGQGAAALVTKKSCDQLKETYEAHA